MDKKDGEVAGRGNVEPKGVSEVDSWMCENADEKKTISRLRLKTKKKLTCKSWFPRWKEMV